MKSCLSSEHKHDFTGKCINMNYIYDLFDKMLMREERNLLGQLYQVTGKPIRLSNQLFKASTYYWGTIFQGYYRLCGFFTKIQK